MDLRHLPSDVARTYAADGDGRHRHLLDDLRTAADERGDDVAFVDRGRTITYAELDDLARRLGGGLRSMGVRPGDAVAWMLPNWHHAAALHWAIMYVGAISAPIVPIYRHKEVSFCLEQIQAKTVLVPKTFRGFDYEEMMADVRSGLPLLENVLVFDPDGKDLQAMFGSLSVQEALQAPAPQDPDSPALLLFTSGTTAEPKCVVHSSNTLDRELCSIVDLFELTETDSVFMPTPLTHITGLLYGVHLPARIGSSAVLQEAWEPGQALDLLEEHRCTFAVGATPFLHGLTHHPSVASRDLALRFYPTGGADVPPSLVEQASEVLRCHVSRTYGSTEIPTLTCSGPHDPADASSRTDGRPIGAAELLLVDAAGNQVPPGVEGEILARAPEMFLGYVDLTAHEEAFQDGWFITGDRGVIDEHGFLTITGRTKDIIIRGGENLSAKEIEDLLITHPGIAEVAVVGSPDAVLGERVCAVVVAQDDAQLVLSDLVDFLKSHRLARQKWPERLVLVTQLPKTASGKIQKAIVRDGLKTPVTRNTGAHEHE